MADITSQERFVTLQWKRGTGYYGSDTHARPWLWESFNEALKANEPYLDKRMRSLRYRAYLVSWCLHNPKHELVASDVSTNEERGQRIVERLAEVIARELRHKAEIKTYGKGKQTKTRKGKGRVR